VIGVVDYTVLLTPSSAIGVSANSADLTVGRYLELAVDVDVSNLVGTTPSYQLIIERKGADGLWYPIYTGVAITAIGKQSVSLGVGASTNVSFGGTIRVREVIAGTAGPSVTRSVSIIGK
jgi:hypothetical protein